MMMNFGSLFSGVGGFDLAFERAGMRCLWQVEIDKNCQILLKDKFNTEVLDDVRNVGKFNLKPIDVICGGFPCQDLSIAGTGKGLDGERSGLWFEFARIIDELKPEWVVIENVPGLLSNDRGRAFETIIRKMADSGYGVCWRVLDSQYFGVPQRRRRVYIIGHFGDGRAAEILFEPESVSRYFEKGKESKKENSFTLRANPSHSGGNGDGGINTTLIAGTLTWKNKRNNADETFIAYPLTTNPYCDRSSEENNLIVGSLSTGFPARDASDAVNGHLRIQNMGIRRLMPCECEKLQGFPPGWTSGFSDSARYRMLGNAVTVNVAEWIGKRIMEVE